MSTSANIVVVPCIRTQHVRPNYVNVACCWQTMLPPFAWTFMLASLSVHNFSLFIYFISLSITSLHFSLLLLCFCLHFSIHFAFLHFALFFILAFACLSSCLTRFCLAWLAYALPCPSFVCFTQFTFLHSFCFYFSFNCFALPSFTLYLSLLCSGFL